MGQTIRSQQLITIVAVAFATHRWPQAVGLQPLLIIIGTILAATIRMEDAVFGGLPQVYRNIERPDCQILLHSVADRPAHNTAAVKIENGSEIERALGSPYIGDVAHFWLGAAARKSPSSQFAATPRL